MTINEVLTTFGIDIKNVIAACPTKAVEKSDRNPRLADISEINGEQTLIDLLKAHLTHTFLLCGFEYGLGIDETTTTVATRIATSMPYYRIGEISLFLSDFENGMFGVFATRFNIQKFFDCLNQWQKRRCNLEDEQRKIDEARKREEMASKSVSCPEDLEIFQKYFKK